MTEITRRDIAAAPTEYIERINHAMTHITQQQRKQITTFRAESVSFRQIAKRLDIPLGTCKTIFYTDKPPLTPPARDKAGKFTTVPVRTGPGRRPKNGLDAQSDKERAAAYRARKKAALVFRDAASHNETEGANHD